MRKYYWIALLLFLTITGILFFSVVHIGAQVDNLILHTPDACPTTGCAAGQRLNFRVTFAVSPNNSQDPNTQICVYAPNDGQTGPGSNAWASDKNIWISSSGILTGVPYTQGETESLCSNNTTSGEAWITGATAKHNTTTNDRIEFAFNINPTSDIAGDVTVKVFQLNSSGTWTQSASYTKTISVAQIQPTVYIGRSAQDCADKTPCFVNSGDDSEDGLGTALRDAVVALEPGSIVWVLNDYTVKDNTVLIDKNLAIHGEKDAMISYIGVNCNQPMLSFTNGGTLKDLSINDGNCASPSRNLIEIDSPNEVIIEHNTLNYGYRAINIKNNSGNVIIAFNQIANNQDYAIFRESGIGGKVSAFANNIINNRSGFQVNCNSSGSADHNFWGDGVDATSSALNCMVNNGKRLGASILLSPTGSGVEAIRKQVTSTASYAFNNKISVKRSLGSDYNVIIVNHGQGQLSNVPFYQSGIEQLEPCSNYYDVFLEEGSAASNLILSLKYDLNSNCINTIETSSYCAQSDSSKYPLWWYDPANNVTDGWDRTGQNPEGSGAGGATGQTTSCDMTNNEISVTIDNTGRPGISNDLNYTPFVTGLPLTEGITLSQFTAVFNITKNDLKWITTSEVNVKGFHVLRSESQAGTYTRISPLINAIGDTYIGGSYNYTDTNILFTKTYYYKIEVINLEGDSINTYGPVSVLTSTATPTTTNTRTSIPTNTPFPTRTATPYYYRSPTSYYRPVTSTPRGYPTQVRTFGPSPTLARTTMTEEGYPVIGSTATPFPDSGYPVETTLTATTAGYPALETPDQPFATKTTIAIGDVGTQQPEEQTSTPITPTPVPPGGIVEPRPEEIRWSYLLVGLVSGLGVLGVTSLVLAKIRFT